MREEELINQLIKILDEIDINELGIQNQLKKEIERYSKFSRSILGANESSISEQANVDMKKYIKYLLREGSVQEKRRLLENMQSKIVMNNKEIKLAK